MIKNTTIMMMIANEMERLMISLLLYLFSSWLVSSEVILVLLSISLVTVGPGVISIGVLLTISLSSFAMAGVWDKGVCGGDEVVDIIVSDGVAVVACTMKQEKEKVIVVSYVCSVYVKLRIIII